MQVFDIKNRPIQHEFNTLIRLRYSDSLSTYKSAQSTVNTLLKGHSYLKYSVDIVTHGSRLLEDIMRGFYSDETKRKQVYYCALLINSFTVQLPEAKALHTLYIERYMEIKKKLQSIRTKNTPINEKEKNALQLTLGDLRKNKIMKEYTPNDLLYNLLIFIDETPRLDFRLLQFYENATSEELDDIGEIDLEMHESGLGARKNLLVKTGKRFAIILNNYKTFGFYGTWHIGIHSNPLTEYLTNYLNLMETNHLDFLFLTPISKEIYQTSKFSQFTQRMFEKKVGLPIPMNTIRKMKEMYLFHKNPIIQYWSTDTKERWVKKYFKHSLPTSVNYYDKVVQKS